jgi:hypothetical protein
VFVSPGVRRAGRDAIMGLTEIEFSQVRRAMHVAGIPATEDRSGKRRSPRLTVDAIVAFAPCREPGAPPAEAAPKWVNVMDLSRTGVSINAKMQLAPGECFVLALPADGDRHVPVLCTVQYSRVKLDGTFRVGAEFCDPAAANAGIDKIEAALAALRGIGLFVGNLQRTAAVAGAGPAPQGQIQAQPRPSAQSGRGQRRSERRLAEGRAVIHTYDEAGEPGAVEEVPTLDFSETGVCIFRREPLNVGDHFMARIPLQDSRPIISLCRVTNVSACNGENRYRIGAEFIPLPSVATRVARRVMKWFSSAA